MSNESNDQRTGSNPESSDQPRTLQGWVPDVEDKDALFQALNEAFDYRGDVTLTTRDGEAVEGFIFDRKVGQGLEDSKVRIMPKNADQRRSIPYKDIARLEFSGKDTAAGHSFETWIKKYVQKKMKGEKAEYVYDPIKEEEG